MRVFIYEYTCATAQAASILSGLQAEGWAMLSALLTDFGQLPSLEVLSLVDERCAYSWSRGTCQRIRAGEEWAHFYHLAGAADYTLVIAPEFDELLVTRCRWVLAAGGRLLGPSPSAVTLTSDKLAFGRHLHDHAVPTPETQLLASKEARPLPGFPLIMKPRHGAGSQATFLIQNLTQFAAAVAQALTEGWQGEFVVQPFVPGQPASVAFLLGPLDRLPLVPSVQRLSEDGRFHYLGGALPLPADQAERALRLASKAVTAVPGLHGYVGVDLILGEAHDGSNDYVIEINPRLTTSYVGLRALAQGNLAGAMLAVARGEETPTLRWRTGRVEFDAYGEVR
jgi:predicted ATP-grasp superfamily ATP-dependent carboligase